jgi:hypothetical protein
MRMGFKRGSLLDRAANATAVFRDCSRLHEQGRCPTDKMSRGLPFRHPELPVPRAAHTQRVALHALVIFRRAARPLLMSDT